MGFSNPMQMMISLMGNKTNPFTQQMPQTKQNSYPPINQQQLINAIPKLSKEDLARVVQQARAQGISEESIEQGLNFLLQFNYRTGGEKENITILKSARFVTLL